MQMGMELQVGARTLHHDDGATLSARHPFLPKAVSVEAEHRADEDARHGSEQRAIVREPLSPRERDGEHPLPQRHPWQDALHQVGAGGGRRLAIRINFQSSGFWTPLPLGPYTITGTAEDGRIVSGEQAYVRGDGWDSSSGAAYGEFVPTLCRLTDPAGVGHPWTKRILYLKQLHVLGPQQWADLGLEYKVRAAVLPGTTVTSAPHTAGGTINSALSAESPTPRSDDFAADKSRTLHLLSLAARCPIYAPMEEVYDGAALVETRFVENTSAHDPDHPLIPRMSIGAFMQQVAPGYTKDDPDLDLPVLIQYYCRSHTETVAEFKFLFAGVVMESLKFHWALNKRKLPTKKNANGIIKDFLDPTNQNKRYSFEGLIKMVASDLNLSHTYTFIENRNTNFHTGKSAASQLGAVSSYAVLKPELVTLQDQIDDLLLTILGYTGPISSWWQADATVTFPGRAPIR